jgi:outer membrane protein TolC
MRIGILAAPLGALLLSACASFSPDGGFGTVETLAKERTGKELRWVRSDADADSVQSTVKKMLASPLSADAAVQVALLNNRGLQATYAELGLAEANLVQAGRLRGPGISVGRFRRGDEIEIERAFILDLLGLLTMPTAKRIEGRRFEQAKLSVASDVVRLAAETRRAWIAAVAAQESVKYLEQVKLAAESSAELARRMAGAGNFSKLAQMREQLFYAEVAAQLARAGHARSAERENLTRLMGLWGEDTRFALPERMPDLPGAFTEQGELEAVALRQRLDIQASRREVEGLAESLGLTRTTRFINVFELGYQRNSETGAPTQTGWEVELRFPLFDWGGARVARAEFIYMQSLHRAADTAVRARSEVREAYSAYRTAYDLAKHYRDEIVPLRKKISEENLLRYNGMLIGVFELIADAREQVASVNGYLDALRAFWQAEADLQTALTGRSPGRSAAVAGGAAAAMPASGGH